MVASQATHLGVSHLGAAAGLRAQVTHLVLAAHSELSHPPRGRSRTSGAGHSLRSRRITPGSGRSPRSRRLRPLTSVSQQDLGLRHPPRCRNEPRAQASHREPRGMANYAVRLRVAANLGSGRSPRIRSRRPSSGHPPRIRSVSFHRRSDSSRAQGCSPRAYSTLVFTKAVAPHSPREGRRHHGCPREGRRQRFRPIDGQPRYGRKGYHPGACSTLVFTKVVTPHSLTKVADTTFVHEKVAGNASVLSMVSLLMSARVVTQRHAALSSSQRSWHQKSSHEGRRHHCLLREDRRQSLRPIDGQPR